MTPLLRICPAARRLPLDRHLHACHISARPSARPLLCTTARSLICLRELAAGPLLQPHVNMRCRASPAACHGAARSSALPWTARYRAQVTARPSSWWRDDLRCADHSSVAHPIILTALCSGLTGLRIAPLSFVTTSLSSSSTDGLLKWSALLCRNRCRAFVRCLHPSLRSCCLQLRYQAGMEGLTSI